MTEGRTGLRLKVLGSLVVFMLLALTVRLWFLQVLATERYRDQASQNAVRLVDIEAPRGRILDANGTPIVDNQFSLQVTVDRDLVRGHEEQVLFGLSNLLKIDVPSLTKRLESKKYLPYAPVPVAFNVSKEIGFAIKENPERFPGVDVKQVPARQYPYRALAAHVLGYIGPINAEQYGTPDYAAYDPNDFVGQAGLENRYESFLRGTKGAEKLKINAAGKVLCNDCYPEKLPVKGDDIRLNIDLGAQQLAEQSLQLGMQKAQDAGYPADAGAVVVMDPTNGAVKAITSSPSFNPAIYNGGLTQDEVRALGLAPHQHLSDPPLLNRAMDGLYPPGSTIKPFVAMSALREGFATENQRFPCPGTFTVPQDLPGNVWHNWTSADLGYMTLREAIIQSCDTVFYHLGYYDYWSTYYPPPEPPRQPKEWLQRDFNSFGFGEETGIDFPSSSSGLVPTNEWKQNTFSHVKDFCTWNWCPGDYINMVIGQGNMRVTPLQLAMGFSAIANDGTLCEPQLVADAEVAGKIVERFDPSCHQLPSYPRQWFRYIQSGLEGVPRPGGTASSAFIGFPFGSLDFFGGKTGTAQVPGKEDFSWFAGVAKGRDRKGDAKQYVVVALVEQAGHGSETAAPIVRQVIDGLFGLRDRYTLSIGQVAD